MSIAGDQSFAQNINATIPTIGAGILFNHATFYVGFSTPNLIGNSLASRDDFELSTPYFGYFGYRFYNNRFQDFIVKPNMLIKYEEGAPVQLDFNTAISFKSKKPPLKTVALDFRLAP